MLRPRASHRGERWGTPSLWVDISQKRPTAHHDDLEVHKAHEARLQDAFASLVSFAAIVMDFRLEEIASSLE
jgi:hypothetical protein